MTKWDCLETPFLQNRHTDMLIVLYLSVLQMFLLLQKFQRIFAFKCKVNFKLHLFSAQLSNFTGVFIIAFIFITFQTYRCTVYDLYIQSVFIYIRITARAVDRGTPFYRHPFLQCRRDKNCGALSDLQTSANIMTFISIFLCPYLQNYHNVNIFD